MNNKEKFLTLRDVAEMYSLSLSTIRKWSSERKFPLYKISNSIRVSDSEFREWIEKFKIQEHNNDNQ